MFELSPTLRRPVPMPVPVRARTSAATIQRCGDHGCPAGGCEDKKADNELFRSATRVAEPGLRDAHDVTARRGEELPGGLAHVMSSKFGYDFSQVRVHHDDQAAASAARYAAAAYTLGLHIVFGANRYEPGTESGRRLIIHELTHVVQARRGAGMSGQISSPSDASEQEASRIATTAGVTEGTPVIVGASPATPVQRQEHAGQLPSNAPAGDVPAEKWSQDLEAAYRAQGDGRRALAIRHCRETGGQACTLVLTQSEVSALYSAANDAKGDEKKVGVAVSRLVPVLGLLGPLPLGPPPVVTIPAPSPVPGIGGGVAGGAAGGASVGVVAGAAIVGILVIAGIQLWELGKFQHHLETQGYIILDDALAVCIKGCHNSPVRLPTVQEPRLLPTQPFPNSRMTPSDEATIRKWLDQQPATPAPTRQTSPQPLPAPSTRRGDPDTEEENRRGCRATATYQRGGNTCHDQFATSVSGVPREWLVTTPQGLSESFDARASDGHTVFEMKTGYGFLGINNPTPRQRKWIESTRIRWHDQAARQQVVADACGYHLVWYFTNRAAAAFADGIIEARTVVVPFRCDSDGERGR